MMSNRTYHYSRSAVTMINALNKFVITTVHVLLIYISQDQNKDSRQKLTRVIKEIHGIKQAISEVKMNTPTWTSTCSHC